MGHVLARLAGYGLALVPYWPYLYPHKDGRALVFTAQSREPGAAAARHGLEWMLGLV